MQEDRAYSCIFLFFLEKEEKMYALRKQKRF